MKDKSGRNINYLRISVTDKCNLRCRYCMPDPVPDVEHEEILRYEEILRICEAAVRVGIRNFKITGGEPLVRKDCVDFMRRLKETDGVETVTLTTNGMFVKEHIEEFKHMGLDGINISLDTLDREQFFRLTGTDGADAVVEAVSACASAGLKTKVNSVLLSETKSQILRLAHLAQEMTVDVRFIEVMPIGFGRFEKGPTEDEALQILQAEYPDLAYRRDVRGNGPAVYYGSSLLQGYIGFIAANTHRFCDECNRMRLTSTGFLKPCLCYDSGIDLKAVLRGGSGDSLTAALTRAVKSKPQGHCFSHIGEITENKTMNRIGG